MVNKVTKTSSPPERKDVDKARQKMLEREKIIAALGRPSYSSKKLHQPTGDKNVSICGYRQRKIFLSAQTKERVLAEKRLMEAKENEARQRANLPPLFHPRTSVVIPPNPSNNFGFAIGLNQERFSLPTNITQYGTLKSDTALQADPSNGGELNLECPTLSAGGYEVIPEELKLEYQKAWFKINAPTATPAPGPSSSSTSTPIKPESVGSGAPHDKKVEVEPNYQDRPPIPKIRLRRVYGTTKKETWRIVPPEEYEREREQQQAAKQAAAAGTTAPMSITKSLSILDLNANAQLKTESDPVDGKTGIVEIFKVEPETDTESETDLVTESIYDNELEPPPRRSERARRRKTFEDYVM